MWAKHKQTGFTIVELLIVIVVIAILATITIVAYNGIQDRARASAASSALSNAVKKIKYAQAELDNTASLDCTAFSTALGVSPPSCTPTVGNTSYQYTQDHNNTGSYCITATVGNRSYKVTGTNSTPTTNACVGHGSGGVAAVTNLALNPSMEAHINGWSAAGNATTTISRVTDQFYSGAASLRAATDGSAVNQGVFTSGRTQVSANKTYTASVWVKGESGKLMRLELGEWDSVPALTGGRASNVSTAATGNWQQLTVSKLMSATAASADIVIRNVNAVSHTYNIDAAMITEGNTTYNYGDGNTAGWVWNGTVNNATSTGPPS